MHDDYGDRYSDNLGAPRVFRPYIESNSRAKINVNPHYSDPAFSEPKTTYLASSFCLKRTGEGLDGQGVEGLSYVYSDRLAQWDHTKFQASAEVATRSGAPDNSADWFSAFMSHYNGKDIEVLHVIAGVNVSNGYPFYVLGHREKKALKQPKAKTPKPKSQKRRGSKR